MFFGSNERVLASKRSGGLGEKPNAVSNNKSALEKISIGAGRRTVHRTYFLTISKTQSWRSGVWRSPIKRNKAEHINRPATKMPIAIRTPSWEKPIDPLRTSAR